MITLKSDEEIRKMRVAGRIVADLLKLMEEMIRPGIDTLSLDRAAEELLLKENAKPAFKGYRVPGAPIPFPGTICASINEEVVHGIPSEKRILREGDEISIDVGAAYEGYYGDAARTFAVGEIKGRRAELIEVTHASLYRAISAIHPGATLGDVGHAVESYVTSKGFGLVRDYAGHGVGRHLHEPPQIPNYGRKGEGITLKARMTIAVEPMVMAGKEKVELLPNGWTVVTVDRSDAAHFEHTLLVTQDGAEILTPWE